MKLFRKAVTVAAAATVAFIGIAPAANADGLHLIGPGGVTWAKGCDATYSLDDRASSMYGKYVDLGLRYVTPFTGIHFERIENNDATADIRYSVVDSLAQYGQDVQGVGDTNGNVALLPLDKLQYTEGQVAENLRLNLIVHESLHVLGLGHDNDEGQTVVDEIMNEMLPVTQITFGNGDKTGMEHIRATNGCDVSGLISPTPTDPIAIPPSKSVPTWKGFTARTVTALVPTRSVYMVKNHKTVILKLKRLNVQARSDGKNVWVKFDSGWQKVPYTYKRANNTLNYSESYRLIQGIENDLLGGDVPRYVY